MAKGKHSRRHIARREKPDVPVNVTVNVHLPAPPPEKRPGPSWRAVIAISMSSVVVGLVVAALALASHSGDYTPVKQLLESVAELLVKKALK